MKTVNLGELEVSAIGLGCMGMSQAYGKADPVESERTLHRALDIGVTFLDTANVYGLGHNEELVGRVLKGRRSEMQLATKFGIVVKDGKRGIDGHPDQVILRCDESLARLQTEVTEIYSLPYTTLFRSHAPPKLTPAWRPVAAYPRTQSPQSPNDSIQT